MNKISLPYPISANRYWRSIIRKGRIVVLVSAEAKAYKAVVGWNAVQAKTKIVSGDVKVNIILHPKLTKKGLASNCIIDLKNADKILMDALEGIAFQNDKQIKDFHATVGEPVDGGGVTIEWGEVSGN